MDFELVLFLLFVVSGCFWFGELVYLKKYKSKEGLRPIWLEYTAGFFPVILVVFIIRSFVMEPFNIPSGSMIPTLRIGDLILVNKYEYGIRIPILHSEIIKTSRPKRGDIAVFRYPEDDSLDYIKRVVGLPGDTLIYKNKQLTINNKVIVKKRISNYLDPSTSKVSMQFAQTLGKRNFQILNSDEELGMFLMGADFSETACKRIDLGLSCIIPEKKYFVLGDNRDNSSDSRFWGFVPEENLVGRAFLVWFNLGDILDGRIERLGFME
jgi:signal peptidase I